MPVPAYNRRQAEFSIILAAWANYPAAVEIDAFACLLFWAEKAFQSRLLAKAAVEIMDADGNRETAIYRLRNDREFTANAHAPRLLAALEAPDWPADAPFNAGAVWGDFKQSSLNLKKWGQR